MMPDDPRADSLLGALAGLRALDLDPVRAASLRARCHAALGRPQRVQAATAFAAGALFRRVLEPALIGGACTVYLAEVIRRAAALFGP